MVETERISALRHPLLRETVADKYGGCDTDGRESEQADPPVGRISRFSHLPPHAWRSFCGVCLLAALNSLQYTAFLPTQLLYLKHLGFATDNDVSFFVQIVALSTAAPIFTTMILGMLSSRIGSSITLAMSSTIACVGTLSIIVVRSRFGLIFGFLAYGLTFSNKTVRQIFISEHISYRVRTQALSFHSACAVAGSLLGPPVWLLCNLYKGQIQLITSSFTLNSFTLTFLIVASINAVMTIIAIALHFHTKLVHVPPFRKVRDIESNTSYQAQEEHLSENRVSKLHSTVIFCTLQVLVNSVVAILRENFQAFLVVYFNADGNQIGLVYEIVIAAELIPPILVAFASRYLRNRQLLVIGLFLKLCGSILYLPIFGAFHEWQIIVGIALLSKASVFFETSLMSILSINVPPESKGTIMGLVGSSASFGYVISQYSLGTTAVKLFGSFQFGILATPLIISLLLVLWPRHWRSLNC